MEHISLLFVEYVADMVHITGNVWRNLSSYYVGFPYNTRRKFSCWVTLWNTLCFSGGSWTLSLVFMYSEVLIRKACSYCTYNVKNCVCVRHVFCPLHSNFLTNEQTVFSSPWKASSSSAIQDIPCILCNTLSPHLPLPSALNVFVL